MISRRPSDRQLRRWLATGRPRRIDRLIETDPTVARRLDVLTGLAADQVTALEALVTPAPEFEERAVAGVHRRREHAGTASLVMDLLGLGFSVGRAVVDRTPRPDGRRDEPNEPGDQPDDG